MTAYETLYRAYRDPLLHRIIRPRVAGADAEDVLVATFTTALERLDSFTWKPRGFFAWLARIATNKCHDLGRKVGRAQLGNEALAAEPTEAPTMPDEHLVAAAGRAEALKHVDKVLAELNPRYARALTLRLLEDRPRVECAEVLEVKLGTFDVLLLRAVRSFRATSAKLYARGDLP